MERIGSNLCLISASGKHSLFHNENLAEHLGILKLTLPAHDVLCRQIILPCHFIFISNDQVSSEVQKVIEMIWRKKQVIPLSKFFIGSVYWKEEPIQKVMPEIHTYLPANSYITSISLTSQPATNLEFPFNRILIINL